MVMNKTQRKIFIDNVISWMKRIKCKHEDHWVADDINYKHCSRCGRIEKIQWLDTFQKKKS